ncbi:MAG: DUF1499 domain-containing protein [Sphingosinicella sp.]
MTDERDREEGTSAGGASPSTADQAAPVEGETAPAAEEEPADTPLPFDQPAAGDAAATPVEFEPVATEGATPGTQAPDSIAPAPLEPAAAAEESAAAAEPVTAEFTVEETPHGAAEFPAEAPAATEAPSAADVPSPADAAAMAAEGEALAEPQPIAPAAPVPEPEPTEPEPVAAVPEPEPVPEPAPAPFAAAPVAAAAATPAFGQHHEPVRVSIADMPFGDPIEEPPVPASIRVGGWLAPLGYLLAFGGVAAGGAAALGSNFGLWDFRMGFDVLRYAFYAAAGGFVLALLVAWLSRRGPNGRFFLSLLAMIIAGIFVAYLGNQVWTARTVPPIHDISTDLDNPPAFQRLALREDNFENVPDMDRDDLAAMPPQQRWRAIHREAYGDIATIRVPWTVGETSERARAIAERRGWEIAHFDANAGEMEATETSLFFRFKDDVVLRIAQAPGGGSLVDMRSVSRVGTGDVGVNARRVRDFLAELRRG